MKTIFTAGEVAKICKVAPRTVFKWFDSGRLRGYRIPGSQDRRIPREHLIRFLKEHGMPLDGLAGINVLLVGLPTSLQSEIAVSFRCRKSETGKAIEMKPTEARELAADCWNMIFHSLDNDYDIATDDAGVIASRVEATVILALIHFGYIEEDPHGRSDEQLRDRATDLPQRKGTT